MTDVVYVVGHGTGWADNELRFSLRSLDKFVTGIGRVYIVGRCPAFLHDVTHVSWGDHYGCKERNIMEKVAAICGHPDLTETFLHVHDDHFCLAPVDAGQVPNYAGHLDLFALAKVVNPKNPWRQAVENTAATLRSRGLNVYNFDIHTPIIFEKAKYLDGMEAYDWRGTPRGFVVKSIYANTLGLDPVHLGDVKLNDHFALADIVKTLKGRPWFSIGNGGLSSRFKSLLMELYPKPSRWERF